MPVIVYSANLRLLASTVCSSLLNNEERGQAARIVNSAAREEFVKSRALLRAVLSKHTRRPAQSIEIATGAFGKPVLADACGLHFNVSHSAGMVLIAISTDEIGVDIEHMSAAVDHHAIAQTVFAPGEIDMLDKAPHGQVADVFFSLWTRKEAYLKATGCGFSSDLPAISTARGRQVLDESCASKGRSWYVRDLPAPSGFKAALVSPTETAQIRIVDLTGLDDLGSAGAHDQTCLLEAA